MRTSAAAASIVTSAASTFPQPEFDQQPSRNISSSSVGDRNGSFPFSFNNDWNTIPLNTTSHKGNSTSEEGNFQFSDKFRGENSNNISTGFDANSNMEGNNNNGPNNIHSGKRITEELEDVVVGIEGALASDGAPSEETIAELQLQTARKLRQLLPTCRDSLHLIQERNWIPLLLGWLNLHDRPAVQVEALWALTNIAGLSSPAWSAPPPAAYLSSASSAAAPLNSNSYTSFSSSADTLSSGTSSKVSGGVSRSDMPASTALNSGVFSQTSHSNQTVLSQSTGASLSKLPPPSFSSGFPPSKKPYQGSSSSAAAVLSSAVALASSSSPLIPPPTSSIPQSTNSQTMGNCSVPPINIASSLPQPTAPMAPSSHLLLRHPDAIPTLVSLLSSPNHEVHEQALWILGSVAAGDGGGSNFSGGVGGSNNASNPASSSSSTVAAARETMLAAGIIPALTHCLESNPHNLPLQRIGSWAFSNLVDGQFQQNNSNGNNKSNSSGNNTSGNNSYHTEIDAKLIIPTLRRMLHMADAEVLSHICWTLSHLCDGPSSHIAAVVSPAGGLVPRLVDLLLHPSWRVTKPALRTIGNIVCAECVDDSASTSHLGTFEQGSDMSPPPIPADYTEIILEYGAVPRLKELITHGNREIQKEACWTLSNIAAGTVDQIQAVIDCGAIAPLVKLASDPNTDQEVRSEACWVVLNATSCGSDAQIEVLVSEGCVAVLGVLLGEASMVMMALEGLERVLQVEESKELARRASAEARNENNASNALPMKAQNIEEDKDRRSGSVVSASLIEMLEGHKNSAVSKRAGKIWKQHFVNCALCRQSFSRHRSSEVHFCKECKCHVCTNCDCEIYHLSYQEELWAVTEEKTEAKTKAKKSKKQKKKEKKKAKKQSSGISQEETTPKRKLNNSQNTPATSNSNKNRQYSGAEEDSITRSRSSSGTSSSGSVSAADRRRPPVDELAVVSSKPPLPNNVVESPSIAPANVNNKSSKNATKKKAGSKPERSAASTEANNNTRKTASRKEGSFVTSDDDEDLIEDDHVVVPGKNETAAAAANEKGKDENDIDLVLYLQQTGSIIALAKLMDALELDGNNDPFIPDDMGAERINNQCVLSRHAEA